MNLSQTLDICYLEELIHRLSIPSRKNSFYYDQLIQSLDISRESVKSYCTWKQGSYTRNLVHSTDLYELLILCWQKGQASPIHDHQGQDCWIYVVEGRMEETLYHPTTDNGKNFILSKSDRIIYDRGDKSYLTNSNAEWHSIQPLSERAITLHLYALPIKKCRVYNLKTAQLSERHLSYS
ncbi:MAG: cysteine dioxygenase family protein [Microcoleaceae cyanobacterium MO_207.B10]|nr:cysteine dioxygenase family protein [Microcoleaceae cyanobacterium MO_207.B10]